MYSQGKYLAVQAFSTGRQALPELSTRHQGVSRLLLRMRSVLFSWLRTQLFVSTVLRMCRSIQDCACVHTRSDGTACTSESQSLGVSGTQPQQLRIIQLKASLQTEGVLPVPLQYRVSARLCRILPHPGVSRYEPLIGHGHVPKDYAMQTSHGKAMLPLSPLLHSEIFFEQGKQLTSASIAFLSESSHFRGWLDHAMPVTVTSSDALLPSFWRSAYKSVLARCSYWTYLPACRPYRRHGTANPAFIA